MNLFLSIPEAPLVSIMVDWLSLRNYARLDSAMCNKKSRAELKKLILTSQHSFAQEWPDYGRPGAQWLIDRGVRCANISLSQELLMQPNLRERFFIHSGRAIQSLILRLDSRITNESNGVVPSSLRGILSGLSRHCTCLKKISITMAWDKYQLSEQCFASIEAFISDRPSLQSLCLHKIENLSSSLLLLALRKLEHVSLQSCTIKEDAPFTTLPRRAKRFECKNTPLPPALCAYVTEVALAFGSNTLEETIAAHVASYTTLSHAEITSAQVNPYVAPLIGKHWKHLVYLYIAQLNEDTVLELIKLLPTLQVFDATGEGEVDKPSTTFIRTGLNNLNNDSPAVSQLYALSICCNQTTTLEEVLQLCPLLTTLSLFQPERAKGVALSYFPVEKSLHLIHSTNVCALYLSEYTTLCDADLMPLQHSTLHILSISESGRKLQNKGLLKLLPTLLSLHTLALYDCTSLSYKLVLDVPPLCLNLRSYTYVKHGNRCCGDNSNSSYVLDRVLPQIFPHVKEFFITC